MAIHYITLYTIRGVILKIKISYKILLYHIRYYYIIIITIIIIIIIDIIIYEYIYNMKASVNDGSSLGVWILFWIRSIFEVLACSRGFGIEKVSITSMLSSSKGVYISMTIHGGFRSLEMI